DARPCEVLQEVAVIAPDLQHRCGPIERALADHRVGQLAGVFDHRVRERAQVRVVREDLDGRRRLAELGQRALLADAEGERVAGPRAGGGLVVRKGVGEGSGPEREDPTDALVSTRATRGDHWASIAPRWLSGSEARRSACRATSSNAGATAGS